jgi:hypothetical protein
MPMLRPPFGKFQRFHDLHIAALFSQAANSGLGEHFDERLRGAVQDGQFQGVQFDIDIVDAAGIERGEQVFRGGKQHALFHQAGGVADASDVSHVRFDLKIVQIHTPEHNSSVGWGWDEPEVRLYGRVETYAFCGYGPLNRSLKAHLDCV